LLLEAGLLLILIPWSAFWDRNYFADLVPGLRPFITNNFVRGAVSGLGAVNIFAALSELAEIFTRPHGREATEDTDLTKSAP
jgi:hypothetical protein